MTAVVVGGGIAGLVAARALLQQGEVVDVFEATPRLGGLVARQPMAGIVVDSGADSFSLSTPVVADLCAELGLDIVIAQGKPHIWWPVAPHRWPMADGWLGIPTGLDDPAIAGALTRGERAVARRDLQMGGDTASDEALLGPLVKARLGSAVVERLVDPVARGVYGVPAHELEADRVAPGLRAAIRQHGSLMQTVSAMRRQHRAEGVAQPVGGLFRLIDALMGDVEAKGGRIHTGQPVTEMHHDGYSWEIRTMNGPLRCDRVLLATEARAAAALLTPLGVTLEVPPSALVFQALLALNHPDVARGPVGSGAIVGRRDPRLQAMALTHCSLKWPQASFGAPDVVRLTYSESPTVDRAVSDASLLLGIELRDGHVVDFTVTDWEMPSAMHPSAHAALLAQLTRFDGLAVTGAWVAGNGIAPVVSAAQEVVA